MMFRVIWVIDYVGEDTFLANLHPSSSFKEGFRIQKSSGKNLKKLKEELEEITYQQIDGDDHYGKLREYTEVSFELTDNCINYLDGIISSNQGKGCVLAWLALIGILWLVKILISWIWPLVKPILTWFTLPLIHNTL